MESKILFLEHVKQQVSVLNFDGGWPCSVLSGPGKIQGKSEDGFSIILEKKWFGLAYSVEIYRDIIVNENGKNYYECVSIDIPKNEIKPLYMFFNKSIADFIEKNRTEYAKARSERATAAQWWP